MRLFLFLLIGIVIAFTNGCGHKNNATMKTDFEWGNATIDGKFFEKTFMLIPVFIDEHKYYMQFDLGASKNVLYLDELPNNLKDAIHDQIKMPQPIDYQDQCVVSIPDNVGIYFENGEKVNDKFNLMNYKQDTTLNIIEYLDDGKKVETIIGTIGREIIKRNCEINYLSNEICFDLDKHDLSKSNPIKIRIYDEYSLYIPVSIDQEKFWALFDTGSSMFPILVSDKGLDALKISENSFTDQLTVSSWGEPIKILMLTQDVDISIGDKLYAAHEVFMCKEKEIMESFNYAKNREIGIIGNKLFLDKTIFIDYENQELYIE